MSMSSGRGRPQQTMMQPDGTSVPMTGGSSSNEGMVMTMEGNGFADDVPMDKDNMAYGLWRLGGSLNNVYGVVLAFLALVWQLAEAKNCMAGDTGLSDATWFAMVTVMWSIDAAGMLYGAWAAWKISTRNMFTNGRLGVLFIMTIFSTWSFVLVYNYRYKRNNPTTCLDQIELLGALGPMVANLSIRAFQIHSLTINQIYKGSSAFVGGHHHYGPVDTSIAGRAGMQGMTGGRMAEPMSGGYGGSTKAAAAAKGSSWGPGGNTWGQAAMTST